MNLISVFERPDRHELLYRLLSERDGTVNISHRKMPSFEEHIKFVESRPYRAWYFIVEKDTPVGACYLSKRDEIGVFVFSEHQGNGYGLEAVRSLIRRYGKRRYLANVNPRNKRSALMFSKLGFRPIQETYELRA